MKIEEYQRLAMRTCNIPYEKKEDMYRHAFFGFISETGEIAGIIQKIYQGHEIDRIHVLKELGDCLWMLAELCESYEIDIKNCPKHNYGVTDLDDYVINAIDISNALAYIEKPRASIINDAKVWVGCGIGNIDAAAKAFDSSLEEVMDINIAKLKARYPEGFSAEKSLHRAEGDI